MTEPTTPPPPPASEPDPPQPSTSGGGGGNSNRTVMLILSYLGPLALVPFLMEKDDKEVQWHAKHGLVLMVMWIAISILFTILTSIPVFGCAVAIVSLAVPLIGFVIHVLCIVKALNGERFLLPGISQYADKF